MNRYILIILVFIFNSQMAFCQIKKVRGNGKKRDTSVVKNTSIMPLLSYNRNLGLIFGVVPMTMYRFDKRDTDSPNSFTAVTGIYTTNKSYLLGVFNKFFLDDDNWRGTLVLINGDISSQFYVAGFEMDGFYGFATSATIASFGMKKKVLNNLYGGVSYTYSKLTTSFQDDVMETTKTSRNGIEFNLLYDSRNNVYYPANGGKMDIAWINYSQWMGNDETANKVRANYNTYFPFRNNIDVFAARFSSTFGVGSIGFEQQSVVGGGDIRGYSNGMYRGDVIIALQGEYRWNLAPKVGFVGFAGVSTLFGSQNENFDGTVLPGGGLGIRYRAFKNIKFNIGLDAALGKDDWGIYFRIGEAF